MVDGGVILPVVSDTAELRKRPPGLDRAGSGGSVVDWISFVEIHAAIADIIHFEDRIKGKLPLDAQAPVLVVAHRHARVSSRQTRSSGSSSDWPSDKEGRHGAKRIVEDGLVELVGNHVVIHPVGAALHFIEDAVATAEYGLVVKGPPCETEARRPLSFVGGRAVCRDAGLGAGLNLAAEKGEGGRRRKLRLEIDSLHGD